MKNSKSLSLEGFEQMVYDWNQTDYDYPKDKTIHQLFEEQVKKTPNNIALVFQDQTITYKELNNRANQLAHYIKLTYKNINNTELGGDTLIALLLDRSIEMIVSILAVLKSGAAYVPISPEFPQQRIDYILKDTQAQILISQLHLRDRLNQLDANLNIVYADSDYLDYSVDNPNVQITSQNLAYVIYTSGTTGKPKGVMLEHQGIINRIQWMQSIYPLNYKDRVLHKTPYTFDVSVWELFWANWYGAAIVIAKPEGHKDCDYLYKEIVNNKVTITHFVPSMLDVFLEYIFSNKKYLQELKTVFCSGEALTLNTVNKFYQLTENSDIQLYNLYGPTEVSIDVSFSLCQLDKKVTIGKPIQNTRLYILDKDLKPVQIGIEGELYIGGAGLARGYLNLPELTQEKFIDNPFATQKDKELGYTRLYKTGDLCKWLDNGDIEYIGRNDFQVKIRGFRIELGEIENIISEIKDIQQVCVIAKQRTISNQKQTILVAYYASDNNSLDSELIKDYIKDQLPEYMLPSAFIKLDKFPLTINGKLDRKALPEPNFTSNKSIATTTLEKQLCKIWSQILSIPENQINTKLSFFDLGGDSLLVTRLKNQLMSLPECQNLSIADLFTYNTIDKLNSFLNQEKDDCISTNRQNNPSIEKDIAVIGISGAFSGCSNTEEFWQLLVDGKRGLTSFDIETCRKRGVAEENLQNPNYVSTSGHIDNVDLFDSEFWNISAHEAKLMDPQIRKFLEHCWLVLEKSGYAPTRSKHNIAVIAGNTNSQYFQNNILNCDERDTLDIWEASVLNTKDALATKVSYLLGLKGISESINTACSTGLVTIIEACNKLANGLCDMAIAGSASLQLPEQTGYIYKEGMILSKDGHCRVFDNTASGTIFGSGVGAVLLKRLSDAEKDKDNIIAVVKGYALNNDGDRKISYTAPSVQGQVECIKQALSNANISSDEIDYVECHGTGTKLGDPIEVKALSDVFKATSKNSRKQKCVLGSSKANIGHADAASGLAGFIKLCLMLKHKQIPIQIDYDKPNPDLNLESSPFTIQTETTEWLSDKPHIAAVSSFGFGGTNAHMIVSEYTNSQQEKEVKINEPYILNLSAKNIESLQAYKESFINYLSKTNNSLNSIVYTLQQRREVFDYRLAVSCYDKSQAIEKLQADIKVIKSEDLKKRQVIWMFPGQGMQYLGMTYALYQNDDTYRQIVDKCIVTIEEYIEVDFKEILFTNNKLINQTQWTQPALFVVEYSLAKLLEHMGLKADAYIGHSIGEYVAATLSGVFNLEDALKIVLKRGELMQQMPAGSMLSISADVATIKDIVLANDCEISVINSPVQCVVSGSSNKINDLKQALDQQEIKSIVLNTSHAYHSSMMIKAAQQFNKCFELITLHKPIKPFISNISGDWIDENMAIDPNYWSEQITATVEFAKGIESSTQSDSIMLEVGPGHALSTFVQQSKTDNKVNSINLIPSVKNLSTSQVIEHRNDLIARMWCYGYPVKLEQIKQASVALLPSYHFNYDSHWLSYDKKKDLSLHLLDEKDWLHTCVWQQSGKLVEIENLNIFSNILLIVNEHTPDWVKYISTKNLVIVFLCNTLDCFQIFNDNEIGINPNLEENYKDLFNYLQNKEIENIIDCSTLSVNSEFKLSKFNEKFESSFYHLYLLQEYVLKKIQNPLTYIYLTQGIAKLQKDDYINPINSSFKSVIRTMSHELPNVNFAMFDVGYNQKNYINSIISEVSNGNILFDEHPYAVRNNSLWVETVETIKSSIKSPNSKNLIKDEDVILLTGGLGGIGLALIEEISRYKSVTFVITTRVKKSASLTNNLFKLLDERNCYIDLQYGDISELKFTNNLVKYINKKYDKLSGIIHLAGIQPLGQDKTFNAIKEAIKPKVFGINNIISELSNVANLRYCILTSSLASIMGDVNRIEYCATNGYLDSLSSWLNQKYSHMQTISINWPSWENTGMAMNQRKIGNIVDLNQIDKYQGAKLFYKLIQSSIYDQIIVSKLDVNRLKKKIFYNPVKSISLENATSRILEKNLDKNYHKIASAALSILGIKQISIHDNLFNLGLNSLDSIQLVNLLNNQGIYISSHQLFNLNSIEAIYKYFFINSKKTKNTSVNQETIVKLKYSSPSKKNVFFIHPVGGILTLYQNLINRLPAQYNYYGIQNINVYGYSKLRFDTLEELSEYYVAEILKIQNCGKFILIGASLGGTVAYEMANQLVKKGKKIQNVIMLDTWANFSPQFNDKKKCEEGMLEQLKGQNVLKAMKISYKDFIDQAWYMMKLNLKYVPKKSSLNIVLYKAMNVEGYYIYNKQSRDNDWQKYISKSVQVYNIIGNHFTLYSGIGLKHINDSLWPILSRQRRFYFKGQRFVTLITKNLKYAYNFVKKQFHKATYLLLIGTGYFLNEVLDGLIIVELL